MRNLRRKVLILTLAALAITLPSASVPASCADGEPESNPGPRLEEASDLVDIKKAVPTIVVDLAYAGEKNFFQKRFYSRNVCFLRRSTAEKLRKVQADLLKQGYGLKIYDGYRPLSVQWAMWKVKPDPTFVADPKKGSRHNRGAAVDVTLVDKDGRDVPMPTGFDDFTPKAASDYPKLSKEVLANRKRLQSAMTRRGFGILPSEWWHFDDMGWKKFPVMDVSIEELMKHQDRRDRGQ